MMPLRVGYVSEHFSSPLLQYEAVDEGKTFVLVECPSSVHFPQSNSSLLVSGGSGQLISRLTNNEIDIAIALTDPLLSGIANGSKAYKLVGTYVTTSLNWAVTTGKDSTFHSIQDLENTVIGISRYGSGSQTMAYVMALQQSWNTDKLKFQVNNDIRGLINSVNDGSTSAFMWEWYTTLPFVQAGEVRFIGSVPTPWPSWVIAATPTTPSDEIDIFLGALNGYIQEFNSETSRAGPNVDYIKSKFGYKEEDIKAWLDTVGYPTDCQAIPRSVITETLGVLAQAGVVRTPSGGFQVAEFVRQDIVNLT